jgi:hypothetical protein
MGNQVHALVGAERHTRSGDGYSSSREGCYEAFVASYRSEHKKMKVTMA